MTMWTRSVPGRYIAGDVAGRAPWAISGRGLMSTDGARLSVWSVAAALVLMAVAVAATAATWADIVHIALVDEESSHIMLVPIVAAWMVWIRRLRLRGCVVRGTWAGPMLILAGWAGHVAGQAYAIQALWHASAVLVVLGAAISILGVELMRRFAAAVAVLAFLIPVPGMVRQQIALPLQTATAAITQALLESFALPVERSANLLTINGVDVAVAEACNGLRMVFALVLVSYGFAFSVPLRPYVRGLIIGASPLAAIVCNVLRLGPTIWMYGFAPRDLADLFHAVGGWLMLPVALLILMSIIRALRWALVPVARFTLAYQ